MQTKVCKDCKRELAVGEFYRHSGMADGRLNNCKKCKKKYAKTYRLNNHERVLQYDRVRNQKPERKAKHLEYQQKRAEEKPEELRAYRRKYQEENAERLKAYKDRYYWENREILLKKVRQYRQTPAGKETSRRGIENYKRRYPEKRAAHIAVGNAIRDGRLIRKPCEICGERAEAHHEDYFKPFQVRWLCPMHHREIEGRVAAYVRGGDE